MDAHIYRSVRTLSPGFDPSHATWPSYLCVLTGQLAEGGVANVGINLAGLLLFGGLYRWEGQEVHEQSLLP